MKTIAYASPFIPPEWIAAHGLRPHWLPIHTAAEGRSPVGLVRGVCPFAGAVIDAARHWGQTAEPLDAVILTTACDQMRYAAAVLEQEGEVPVFLFGMPSTWQSAAGGRLYFDELRRLGRFLAELGGRGPDPERLRGVMREYEAARAAVLSARQRLSARQFAESLAELRGAIVLPQPLAASHHRASPCEAASGRRDEGATAAAGVPLALVGGPLLEPDYALLDRIEGAGARIVLDATEGGQRTLPAPFDPRRLRDEPLAELALAYFGSIPDAFRRPNDELYRWLAREIAARDVRGIVFRRYVWCDLWHAELEPLRERSGVPVLEIDCDGDDGGVPARAVGRVEAFLEMLR